MKPVLRKIALLALLIVISPIVLQAQELIRVSDEVTDPYYPEKPFIYNNSLVFVAQDGTGIWNIWKFDGSNPPENMTNFTDSYYDFKPRELTIFDNKIYFVKGDNVNGYKLWYVDSLNNPVMIEGLNNGNNEGLKYLIPNNLFVFNNKLYFGYSDQSQLPEIWVYDEINPPKLVVSSVEDKAINSMSNLFSFNGKLYFTIWYKVSTWDTRYALCESDGISSSKIVEYNYNSEKCEFQNKLYIGINDSSSSDHATLWAYDGTHDVSMVSNISPEGYNNYLNMKVFQDTLYFNGNDGINGYRLWKYDGIHDPDMVSGKNPKMNSSIPFHKLIFKNKLIYAVNNGLWEYDGVDDPDSLTDFDLNYFNYTFFSDNLYFTKGEELYSYNGLDEPKPITYISTNGEPARPLPFEPELTAFKNRIYMISYDNAKGYGLYFLSNKCRKIEEHACGSYIYYGDTLTKSGRYFYSSADTNNCDSTVILDLSVSNNTSGDINAVACDSYTSPSGKYNWDLSGTYLDTISNSTGCDSVINVNLTIEKTNSSIDPVACESYTSPSGKYMWDTSGTYLDTIPNAAGCDSIITIHLSIEESTSNISLVACRSYTSPSGKYIWDTSGIYMDTIPNSASCDSIITVNLTINVIDTSVVQNQSILTANTNANGATYQWIDSNNDFKPLDGETHQTFTAKFDGLYAVVISENGCIDTSGYHLVNITGMVTNTFNQDVKIYPNPTNGLININMGRKYDNIVIKVIDINGKLIQIEKFNKLQFIPTKIKAPSGVYTINILAEDKKAIYRIVKE
jgi:ELWxxDGT repeat protein